MKEMPCSRARLPTAASHPVSPFLCHILTCRSSLAANDKVTPFLEKPHFPRNTPCPHLPKCRQLLEEKHPQFPDILSNLRQVPSKDLHLFRYSMVPLSAHSRAVWQVRVSHSTSQSCSQNHLHHEFMQFLPQTHLQIPIAPRNVVLLGTTLCTHSTGSGTAGDERGWWQSGGRGPACTQTICSHPPARDPPQG